MPEGVFPKPLCGLYCEDIWQIFILERASTRCFTRWKWKAYSEWTLVISGPHWRGAVFDQTLVKVKVKTSFPAFGDILCYFNMEVFSSSIETVAASSSKFIPFFSFFFLLGFQEQLATVASCFRQYSKYANWYIKAKTIWAFLVHLILSVRQNESLAVHLALRKVQIVFHPEITNCFTTQGHITMFFTR